jgi:hypothetical protein
MNFPAPIAELGFLAAMGGLALSILTVAVLFFLHKTKLMRWVGTLVGAAALVYFGLLFGFSGDSSETTLAPGQEKYFCEIDCHLAYSVRASREELQSDGRQLHVTLRTHFDETTTSPSRPKDVPLTPNPRDVRLIDGQGRTYTPETISGIPLTRELIPAQSYETDLVFRVPVDAAQLRLLVTDPGWEQHLLIGGENSLGHRKTYLAVPAAESASLQR